MTETKAPAPEGNGDPNCPKCKGRGVVALELEGWPSGGAENCICVFQRDLTANVKRVWPVLLTVDSVESSPLLSLSKQSVWITGSQYTFRKHLRYTAFRMGVAWDARVITDSALMTAWLSTAKQVHDPDVVLSREKRDRPSDHFMTLVDLAVPFDLLIIRLGVKAAANKEMANVLTEAINEREQLGKPTWVVDSPTHPLVPGHKCFSDEVVDLLSGFRRLHLKEESHAGADPAQARYAPKTVVKESVGQVIPTQQVPSPKTPIQQPPKKTSEPMSLNRYAPKAIAYQGLKAETNNSPYQEITMPAGPKKTPAPPPAPDVDDEDEFSVASLMAAAVSPSLPLIEDEEEDLAAGNFDLHQAITNFPGQDEMQTNGQPSWLKDRMKKGGK